MSQITSLAKIKHFGTAGAFILYPLLAGFAFAVHPNLFSLEIAEDLQVKIAGFHANSLLHFGHVLMVLAVPLLIVISIHLMNLLETKAAWWGFIGGILAVTGAIILAMDKAALCLVPSALDSLPESAFQAMIPGIEALFQYRGWLGILWLLPLLPIGFILQTVGLVRSNLLPRWQSIPMLIGALLMANPDIDLIGLIATITLGIGFVPYGISLLKNHTASDAPITLGNPASVGRSLQMHGGVSAENAGHGHFSDSSISPV